MKVTSLSFGQLYGIPWTVACQAPLSMEFSRQERIPRRIPRLPFSSPGDLPNPGIKARFPALRVDSLLSEPPWKLENTGVGSLSLHLQILPAQDSNQGLPHCRWILYQLRYQGSQGRCRQKRASPHIPHTSIRGHIINPHGEEAKGGLRVAMLLMFPSCSPSITACLLRCFWRAEREVISERPS